ncbi:3-methyl-2-oxobutanoate hydroxymethyltransferase [Litorimonas cladophorae]|uniref:3-methyl-2-oxobutanoate hydroxymethyltransferase n=1 Tax=Litorimonas cladophorae TaxID=1220491 RepID=A0A918KC35_9PROT|nr:3-methyl-2-oxobutanoate hydroxymethyltransferase [Litorimonas cladophorae]GGX58393.1 3-methyl-2-oxobutanoate hydroxymethyltransferase [Litorimonas cladophorae]
MSAQNHIRRMTAPQITARKGGDPIVCLTAYDAPTAAIVDEFCDLILVGDSLGMVVHGLPSTVGVTLDMMILHGRAVMRASHKALVVVDLPFGSYEDSVETAFRNASRVMMETGCQAVKIESGSYAAETVSYLVERGIPVMSHVGLRPQSMHVMGGFRARGRDTKVADEIMVNAIAAAQAGSFAVVVEGVSEEIANQVTAAIDVPTIGIGASAQCDGQILVTPDMLGQFERVPKFVKKYGNQLEATRSAVSAYANDVKARSFPGSANLYHFKKPAS